ncbi:ShlB/FhaC/HecB family hemolysin secretion/activation protein [Phenylobacterium sp.]|uniref:ShlB/FhaC/HecB family hemolysin secretion/activation protein n=1 Tax=Phenylobacterium sp. TaxID=1871053 RepID=UPI0027318BB2|nr:ShlB/FhaC/HecB family hemolysin secretion/activation protein [Phenylobacterium sp.]MDP1875100.1 ShlB/FhaC/HecB family hemolysin secretion/activation protein [Phenylobacterium sp.]
MRLALRRATPVLISVAAVLTAGFGGGPADLALARANDAAREAPEPEGVAEGRFVLTGLTIDGVSAYHQGDLAPLYANALATEIGVSDLAGVAQALTDQYRRDGYFLARAATPRQVGAEGHARLVVYEGYVGEVAFEGDAVPAVGALLSDIVDIRPLKLADLDRRLALANDLPGIKVSARLEPDFDDPARHLLVVTTQLRRVEGQVYVDNRGGAQAGPWQVYARGAVNSTMRSGDQLGVGVLTTPGPAPRFTQVDISYGAPLPDGGQLRGAVAASKADGDADGLAAALGNESQSASLRVSAPLVRRQDRSLWVQAQADVRRVEQNWTTADLVDELAVARVAVQGERRNDGAYSTAFVQVSRGFGGLGGEPRDGRTRWDADGRFWKLYAYGSHYRDLGAKAGLFVTASGQWSPDPLLSSEEFAAGGLPVGRAYDYAEIMGDRGIAGSAELRVGWDPQLRPLTFVQSYGFIDGAKVWNYNAAPGWGDIDLASAGAGVRLVFEERLSLRFELAKPLTRKPSTRANKGLRGFISLSSSF